MSPVKPGRLPPLPRERCDDEARAAIVDGFSEATAERYLGEHPQPMPNVLSTMLYHPRLAAPFWKYNGVLLRAASIDPRLRELMILRVAWRTRSRYEFVQHVRMGGRVGITAEEVDAIADVSDAVEWTPLEALLLDATDQLIDRYFVDDATWSALGEHFTEQQLIEVVFIVGTYVCLAMAFNSFGLELDDDLHEFRAPEMPDWEE